MTIIEIVLLSLIGVMLVSIIVDLFKNRKDKEYLAKAKESFKKALQRTLELATSTAMITILLWVLFGSDAEISFLEIFIALFLIGWLFIIAERIINIFKKSKAKKEIE